MMTDGTPDLGKTDATRLAGAVEAMSARLGGAEKKAAVALANTLAGHAADRPLAETLTRAAPSTAQARHWARLAEWMNTLAGALDAPGDTRRAIHALTTALTSLTAAPTPPVVAQSKRHTKSAKAAPSRRSRKMTDATLAAARRSEIAAELKSQALSPERQREIMAQLADKATDLRAADIIQIARDVIGAKHSSGRAALDDLQKWTWKRIQARRTTETWAETSSKRL